MANQKKAFVTGWPVNHSRSPIIHRYWLQKHGLLDQGDYVKHPCTSEDLPAFLTNLERDGFVGGNVTVPHKEDVFAFVKEPQPAAAALGAINTIWIENGELQGTNTDGYGFLANLDDRLPGWDNPDNLKKGALVLGAGGASRAIIYALVERGFSQVLIGNRTLARAEQLAERFGPTCRAMAISEVTPQSCAPSLIVNTTSIGMNDGESPIDLTGFSKNTIVHDIVYTPLMTPMLKQADELGMSAVDGLGMLLHQAVLGFEKWFGVRPEVDSTLRQLILDDLGESA